MNVTVLASGRGSNLKALLQKEREYRITTVVSNKSGAGALEVAYAHQVRAVCLPRHEHATPQAHKAALLNAVVESRPDLVVLAGFMMVLQGDFIAAFRRRILNIHPSLLPSFPGLHTHQQAIHQGARIHGCTVHLVDEGLDTGPIIAQAAVEVRSDDTPEELSTRVLEREHELYPWTLQSIARHEISLSEPITYSDPARRSAAEQGFRIPA